MKERVRIIWAIVIIVALVFAIKVFGLMLVLKGFEKCVKITPKNAIETVELNKAYTIEDFFLVENEQPGARRQIYVTAITGQHTMFKEIEVKKDGSFTVTEGPGTLHIRFYSTNPDTEPTDSEVEIPIVVNEEGVAAQQETQQGRQQ
ncbi:MAG: hypothetical protein IKH28_06405 [Lachnospiraceae bacterium]|nr:hypothetical protein [Lachnospiraceae bacterium]